jgi:hypothetical protein
LTPDTAGGTLTCDRPDTRAKDETHSLLELDAEDVHADSRLRLVEQLWSLKVAGAADPIQVACPGAEAWNEWPSTRASHGPNKQMAGGGCVEPERVTSVLSA